MSIAYQLKKVSKRINSAVNQTAVHTVDHDPDQLGQNRITRHPVTLLAVSKTHAISKIKEAFNAGQRHFGENLLQEALAKIMALKSYGICWHYIGPIQSNKTAKIATYFDWVHSVDRFKIAQRLSDQRPDDMPPLNICLQVNISGEASKSGVKPEELSDLMLRVQPLTKIILRGIMCIPAKTGVIDEQRRAFRKTKELYDQLKRQFPHLDTLSMGMSADFESAIAEGSTMVRIGTDIFGDRTTTQQQNQLME